jgi:hypothetical protein
MVSSGQSQRRSKMKPCDGLSRPSSKVKIGSMAAGRRALASGQATSKDRGVARVISLRTAKRA